MINTLHYWNVLNRLVTEAEPPAATTDMLHQITKETYPHPKHHTP